MRCWNYTSSVRIQTYGGKGGTASTLFFRNSKTRRRSFLVVSATRDPSHSTGTPLRLFEFLPLSRNDELRGCSPGASLQIIAVAISGSLNR
ncbi:hypothetical protein A3F27_00815 [Candidatus Kaiserbacteria bacterium RIFCSPHIGHO2_12_FULL_53_13]|uniref:Uncharacterized protein n=1 Tax=Candidatus Kaiserbacteria bacterium RIFCSPHIGHO2_12_FULL_53_13 TaxID=1798502 RepID=A0A1F6E9F7_9BACT|nr:MAG: hypothetical protein A3F27_00815 [Candidatus Kaiserbacteria bacterium RIFCSPHIGHO2_12_FULL_53_13]OGG74606.1 MAG: hypothetical protein A3A37_01980 [Candidatus Kaiserbacteria bacterium RIFCSPLOWO2_01_FULL_52_36]